MVRVGNKFKAALLLYKGYQPTIENDNGYTRFLIEDTQDIRSLLDLFNIPQMINLKVFVDRLKNIEDQIKREKNNGGGRRYDGENNR